MRTKYQGSWIGMIVFAAVPALAQTVVRDLSRTSLEDLTQMEVSINSVSRKDESLWRTAAAAYVIRREEISRTTASSIPELLRSVPGLQVAQVSASTWAVSARGFNSALANKLLVLVDGRTVYSEIYSGAHWDEIDLPLDDVERIEVIRGPGAVIWGSNAVNGVINIITRPARAVSGVTISGHASRIDDAVVVQQGGSWGRRSLYRDSFAMTKRRPLVNQDGSAAYDGESLFRLGGRLDATATQSTRYSVMGSVYGATFRQQLIPNMAPIGGISGHEDDSLLGGFGQGRVEHESGRNDYEVQGYISIDTRHELSASARTFTEDMDAVDHFRAGDRNDVVGGVEIRLTQDAVRATSQLFQHSQFRNYLVDGFIQDEVVIIPNRVSATLGTKLQNGSLAGFQVQPSVRIGCDIDTSQFAWAAVSRSSVAPALQDRELASAQQLGEGGDLPITAEITGNPAFKPETVIAYEAGYRKHITKTLSVDLSSFFNQNQRIQSLTAGTPAFVPGPPPTIQVPLLYSNGYSATSQGVEAATEWRPSDQLHFRANYTWLEAQVHQQEPGRVAIIDGFDSPRNTLFGLWTWAFTPDWNFGGMVGRTGALHHDDSSTDSAVAHASTGRVAGFTRLDINLQHRLGSHFQLAVNGTNLLSARHLEFGSSTSFLIPHDVPRSFSLQAGWTF